MAANRDNKQSGEHLYRDGGLLLFMILKATDVGLPAEDDTSVA